MLMAISAIVVLGTIMALSLAFSSQSAKQTLNDYLHEQAILLTRSAMEYTLLELSGTERNTTSCTNAINTQYAPDGAAMFDINISIQYIGFGGATGWPCNNFIPTINTPESNGTILLDVIVQSSPDLNISEPIRYHRRTLQKL